MPTKTKPKPKKTVALPGPRRPLPPVPSRELTYTHEGVHDCMEHVLRPMVKIYEIETGAIASQTRLIDFIRWWEEREKNGNTS